MQRWIVLLVLVASCSSPVAEPSITTATLPSSTASTSSTTTTTSTTLPTYSAEDVPTLALYLAAIERGVEGTELEGAAFEEPESLINTGVLFCGLLDEGFSPIDVLRAWVAALSTGGQTPTEDDLLLGGVVLGAAVKFICPEYLELLEL
jgi:hypothetical protein